MVLRVKIKLEKDINLGKITDNDFKESSSISIAKSIIEKNKGFKCYFAENDKTPNLDGSILILEDRIVQSTVEVQIKSLPKKYMDKYGYFYDCDTKIFNVVLKKVTRNPVVLLMVDTNKGLVFYKVITPNYVQKLNIGCNKTKRINFSDEDLFDDNKFKINVAIDDMGKRLAMSLAKKATESFVHLPFYDDALNILKENNAVIIIGHSGVGKSDLSVLLAASFHETHDIIFKQDFSLQDLNLISESVKNEPEKQEVILLDDFLGQNELGDAEYITTLHKLIKCLLKLPSKKIILNAREGIFKNLYANNSNFFAMLRNEVKEVKIDYSNVTDKSKLEIIAKYIRHWNLSEEYIIELTSDIKKMENILESEFFTPLIVKHSTNPKFITAKTFADTFIERLENPDSIWEMEYKCLNENAKVYLHTLFSLTNSMVDKNIVDKCYENRLLSGDKRYDDESTDNTFARLENTLIIYVDGNIKFSHPSLNQYLFKNIGLEERKKIVKSAKYIEQLERFDNNFIKDIILDLLLTGKFFELSVLPVPIFIYGSDEPIGLMNHISLKFIKYINKYNIRDKKFEELLCTILENVVKNRLYMMHSLSDIIDLLFSDYYDFSIFISNTDFSQTLFDYADSSNIQKLLKLFIQTTDGRYDYLTLPNYIQVSIDDAISDIAEIGTLNYIESILDEVIDVHNENCEDEYYDDCCQSIVEDLTENYFDEITESAKEAKVKFIETTKLINVKKDIEYKIISDYTHDIIMNKLKS